MINYKKIISTAKDKGFTDIEIHTNTKKGIKLELFLGQIDNNKQSNITTITLRGIYNDKLSVIKIENMDEENIFKKLDDLKECASYITTKEPVMLYDGKGEYPKVEKIIMNADDFSTIDKINILNRLEQGLVNYDKRIAKEIKTVYIEEETKESIINSKGLSVNQTNHIIILYASVKAVSKDDVQSSLDFQMETDFNKLNPEKLAHKIASEAINMLNAKQLETNQYDVVIKNTAFGALLNAFSGIYSGERAIKKLTPLIGKLGKKIMGDNITIIDEGINYLAKSYNRFDSEGVPTKKKNVVDKGVYKTFLHNIKTAKAMKANPTGNGTKLGVSPLTLYLSPGKETFENIISKIETGYYITEFQGLHSGVNSMSCDFSLQTRGYKIINGKIDHPVTLCVISGNFLDMMNSVKEVGNDLSFGLQGGSPSVFAGKMMISGK